MSTSEAVVKIELKTKPNAIPPDGVNKFSYNPDDYEEVETVLEPTNDQLNFFAREDFMINGNQRVSSVEETQNEIVLYLADAIGGSTSA